MKLTWLTDERRYIGTQTEAKRLRKTFTEREVPTVKEGMIEFLNAQEEEREAAIAQAYESGRLAGINGDGQEGASPATSSADIPGGEEAAASAPIAAMPTADGRRTIIEQILELEAAQLPQVVSAAIGRLGEVAGTHGWAAFGKTVYGWSPAARSVEQGLGMLMLAAFDSFGMKPTEKPRKIIPDKTAGDE